jgi:hypothetical protein
MDVAGWQKRLEDNFTVNGTIGGNLHDIFKLEHACGEYFVSAFHGQSVLICSFQSFYIETIRNALGWITEHGWPKNSENYPWILLYYVIMFRSFRACESLLLKGYPLDGYALLRDLKDRAIFLAGIAHNITTFRLIFGLGGKEALSDKDWETLKKKRKAEQHRVLNAMIRGKSGLPDDVVSELKIWEQLFHEEVHGSMLSFFRELGDWVNGKVPLSIGPTPKELPTTIYANRASEIAWLIVRLLPYSQPVENAFGTRWLERHKILDESFRSMQQGLSKVGKKIGDAFIRFVDEKYSFSEPFNYFEADGTGGRSGTPCS